MKIRLLLTLLIFLQLIGLSACVETYDVSYSLNANLLTVEGFVSDQAGAAISISISRNAENNYYSLPLKGCTAELRTGDGSVIPLSEVSEGMYAPAGNFQGKAGQTYQLYFRTPDGKTYESSKEQLGTVPEIKKVYQEFNHDGLLDKTGKRVIGSTVDVYLDFDDPGDTKNYYLWRWKHYEEQIVCITCDGGTLNFTGGTCVKSNSRNPPTFDYQCDRPCWDVFYNNDVNILADDFINGRNVVGRPIAKIPFHTYKGALLEIEQVGVTKEAYLYYKLLKDQSQNTGTLTDTPPSPIIGNVRNINDSNEKVIGYFGAAGTRVFRYWVNRSNYKDPILYPMLGREANFEPMTPFRPPVYPCVLSKFRTPIKPQGWQ
jgi:hypothetical protein